MRSQTASIHATQYRLARHYLNKLRTADAAVRRGQASVSYGLTLFDQEWEQIRHWQAWAARDATEDAARLTRDFPLAGLEVLANRNNLADHATWLEAALDAAQRLRDSQAVRAILYELNRTHFQLGALEQAEHYASELLRSATGDRLSIAQALYGLGSIAEERGLYPEAEQHYQQSLEIFMEQGVDSGTGRALHGLGAIALYLGNHQDAYHYFVRYLELAENHGSRSEVCNALLSVGQALMSFEDYDEAETYIRRAVDLSRTLGFRQILGSGLIMLASWAVEQNQLESACTYYEAGIEAARAIGSLRNTIHGLSSLGYARMRTGNYSAALAHLQEGLQMARDGGMPRYICNLQRNLANTYIALDDLDAARIALHESLTIAQSLGSYPQKVRTVSTVVAYFQRLDQNSQAAIWAGHIMGDPELDGPLFTPVCAQLEAALGSDDYHTALAQGRLRTLDDIVTEILALLA